MMLCVTGGEPLLHPDFFEIMAHARDAGLAWGMTSNATLITPHVARRLARVGMRTISVSIDGLEQTHDRLRRTPGGFRRAMAGIESLLEVGAFSAVQVTTVVNHETISELDDLFRVLDELDIDSWRVIGLEPIGRARAHPELLLTDDDWRHLMHYIRDMRRCGHPLEFGCSHYLGLDFEAEVREWYWLCNAGVYTASVTSTGDVCACLDIERRPETIQGSVLDGRLRDIWEGRFELFRRDLSELSATCAGCEHAPFCRGDAHHSFDYDEGRPMLCMRHVLFD
jgi:radical SAM protein with 4Fe4S-binding SPASM domain